MEDIDLAYAAGIIDGEGCISMSLSKVDQLQSMVSVGMGDRQVPEWLQETFGGALYVESRKEEGYRDKIIWRLRTQEAAEFCRVIRPFLRVKWPQADLLISLYKDDRYTSRRGLRIPEKQRGVRADYAAQMRSLNARGD